MTANILTPGHIKCLETLSQKDWVIVGLLTSKALDGYKKEVVSYEDRKYILDTVAKAIGRVKVVPQDSLDPKENLKAYRCEFMASGDGFEDVEMEAMFELDVQPIHIKLDGETAKTYSSSKILNEIKRNPS